MISLKKILNKILVDLKNTFKKSDTIPIANGGTGATTASGARANLGVKKYTTKTFTSASQSISANSYKSYSIPIGLDGYKPLGIIGIAHGVYELVVVRFGCNSSSATIVVRNITSKAKTASIDIVVLFEEV